MNTAKKKYEAPVMTKVNFKDKELVAFITCKKDVLEGEGGCCAFGELHLVSSELDLS